MYFIRGVFPYLDRAVTADSYPVNRLPDADFARSPFFSSGSLSRRIATRGRSRRSTPRGCLLSFWIR